MNARTRRPAVVGRPCARLAAAIADRGHRYFLERDRFSLWHLAKTPAGSRRRDAEPQLMPIAVEELLRAYSR